MSRNRNDKPRIRRGLALWLLIGVVAVPLRAHNSAVVHPEMTDAAMVLLRRADMAANGVTPSVPFDRLQDCVVDGREVCSFQELWDNAGDLDHPPRTTNGCETDAQYEAAFAMGQTSVLLGVVIEDGETVASIGRVVNHFRHSVTGVGLLDSNASSLDRASELFLFGLDLHDYSAPSQQRSYVYLGRFLHHIEDMASPAHVHNDSHLYGLGWDTDKDDYEGRYVPCILWVNSDLRNWLDMATTIEPVMNAAQIWSPVVPVATPPDNTTLSGFVYNRSTYMGRLQYPPDGGTAAQPTGELAEMFPGGALGFTDFPLLDPWWTITGVGQYFYLGAWGPSSDDWWPDAAADERSPDENSVPAGQAGDPHDVMAPYYIEQMMDGEPPGGTQLVPPFMRTTYALPWDPDTNPVVANATSLMELQADHLLVPPVGYVAGAAEWWFQITNLPPYLRKVEATQTAEVRYTATWMDDTSMPPRVLPEVGFDTTETVPIVDSRSFMHTPGDRTYINAMADLTLRLEFNEPIRDITQLELLDEQGVVQMDIRAVVSSQAPGNDEPTLMDEEATWIYTIEAANIQGLGGELRLRVKATDKHEHWGGVGGELDEKPETPAERDTAHTLLNPQFPWHDANGSSPQFAYDFVDAGDLNHKLLVDTEAPKATLGVTP